MRLDAGERPLTVSSPGGREPASSVASHEGPDPTQLVTSSPQCGGVRVSTYELEGCKHSAQGRAVREDTLGREKAGTHLQRKAEASRTSTDVGRWSRQADGASRRALLWIDLGTARRDM